MSGKNLNVRNPASIHHAVGGIDCLLTGIREAR